MSERRPPALLRLAFVGLSRSLHLLGRRRFLIADVIAGMAWASQRRRRGWAEHRHRLADPQLSGRGARGRSWGSFREYSRTSLDFLWAHDLPVARVLEETRFDGLDLIEAARREHGSAVLALAHAGNWDMAATIALANQVPITTVMQPVGSPAISRLTLWARERRGLEVFRADLSAARGLLRALRRGRLVALLCDIPEAGPTVTVDFRGSPVAFSAVPARLARRVGCPLLPAGCWRESAGYRVWILPAVPTDGSDTVVMGRVAVALGAAIAEHPEQWYPFDSPALDPGQFPSVRGPASGRPGRRS